MTDLETAARAFDVMVVALVSGFLVLLVARFGLWALNRLFGSATMPKGSNPKPVFLGKNVMPLGHPVAYVDRLLFALSLMAIGVLLVKWLYVGLS